jgi:hypothetical protein
VQRVRAHLADGGAGLRSMAGCAARTPTPHALCPCLAAPGRRWRRSDSCAGGESSLRSSRASSIHAIRSSTGCDPRSASRRPTARRSPSRFRTSSQCFATRRSRFRSARSASCSRSSRTGHRRRTGSTPTRRASPRTRWWRRCARARPAKVSARRRTSSAGAGVGRARRRRAGRERLRSVADRAREKRTHHAQG